MQKSFEEDNEQNKSNRKKYQCTHLLNISASTESNDSLEMESLKRTKFETDYPLFKRSKSTKRYHTSFLLYSIKEESNEEEYIQSPLIYIRKGKFSPNATMPKEPFFLLENKKFDLMNKKSKMEMDIVPEIENDNTLHDLLLKSPRIKIPSDSKEDAHIIQSKTLTMNKTPLDTADIITEEKIENETEVKKPEHFAKFENFIDKEEPPIIDVPGNLEHLHDEDIIKEVNDEDVEEEIIKKGLKKKIVCADEMDDEIPQIIPTILAKIDAEEVISELDEDINY